MERYVKVVVLDNEIQAKLVGLELAARGIPHAMRSYRDQAYDGIFQMSRGWGHIEAPEDYRDTILGIVRDLAESAGEPDSPAEE